MDTRDFFKLLVKEAQEVDLNKCETVLGTHGNKVKEWFVYNKKPGIFADLLDEKTIDDMPEAEMHDRMILFIMKHFQQR